MKPQRPQRPTPHSSGHPLPGSRREGFENLEDFDFAEDKELWDLMGKAKEPPTVSPFFARNVVREIRLAEAKKAEAGFLPGLLRRWKALMTGTAVAAAVAFVASLALLPPQHDPAAARTAAVTTAAYDAEIIAQLDELLDDDSIWLDSTVSAY